MSRSPNRILAALPLKEYRRLAPALKTLQVSGGALLFQCGRTRIYFPGTGLCSIGSQMSDGDAIEVALIGNEGAAGLPALGVEARPWKHFSQVANGSVEYMSLLAFDREMAREGAFKRLIDDYSQLLLSSMMQSVACNKLHTLQQRCCRWLVTAHDRLGRIQFELTRMTLADALGISAADLKPVTDELEKARLIRFDQRSVTITDQIGLRLLACNCFNVIKRAREGMLPKAHVLKTRPKPSSSQGKVIRMPGAISCTLCGMPVSEQSHLTSHHCIIALDQEIAALCKRVYRLRNRRLQLLSDHIESLRKFVGRSS